MQKSGRGKGATNAVVPASIAAVDDLRKRIAAEAELIVQETMPNKVLPRILSQQHSATSLISCAQLAPEQSAVKDARGIGWGCVGVRGRECVLGANDGVLRFVVARGLCFQVAELTRIIEEDELFKYPEKDDVIGQVRLHL